MATKARHLKTPLQLWIMDNRKRLGLTPADLAKLTDVSVDTARAWESRGAPSADALEILQRKFGVPLPTEPQALGDLGSVAAMLTTQNEYLARITVALEKLAGISPEDPEPQLSPADSTVLRSIAKSWEPAPTTSREGRPEEAAT